ncbi:hypothetical protein [Methylobacterium sp. Leaf85]|uniref:hypothetical protein n=1 Tax=Methylobacterium sp. Leaf85 TaxID=1736241 RepID=UPI0006F646BD|nr:hypothetical protein [Methylobacterium sp. Leaf85]KQO53103.1 hypothetical protein ASF08_19455 [Methylobacterium sp. Leaf85]
MAAPASLARAGSHQAFWSRMRALSRIHGGFTISDISDPFKGSTQRLVRGYILACAKAHVIEAVGTRKSPLNRVTRVYRVNVTNSLDPIAKACALPAQPGPVQTQIWTAMRGMGSFRTRDLALQASTDDISVSTGAARDYARALIKAGYLQEVHAAEGRASAVLRLKPGMNTGPRPPAVLSQGGVLDRNRNVVFGSGDRS